MRVFAIALAALLLSLPAGSQELAAPARQARALKAQTLAELGRPQASAVTIGGRAVSIRHSRDPWVDARGDLNVRVQVLEGAAFRGIGKRRVRDEHIRFVNPPLKVPTGARQSVVLEGMPVEVDLYTQNPAAALEEIVRQTIALIGVHEQVAAERGDTTTVIYPDAGTGGTTVDGYAQHTDGGGTTWDTLHDGAGTSVSNTGTVFSLYINTVTTAGLFANIRRGIATFDTSAVGADAISSATLSLYVTGKQATLGETRLSICAANPASDNILVTADYAKTNFGGTEFASLAYAGITTSAYNNFSLNASGIAAIDGAGITGLGLRLGWDFDDGAPTWVSGAATFYAVSTADTSGTTNDPKLTVEHEAAPAGGPGVQPGIPF